MKKLQYIIYIVACCLLGLLLSFLIFGYLVNGTKPILTDIMGVTIGLLIISDYVKNDSTNKRCGAKCSCKNAVPTVQKVEDETEK